ncbi:macro domain-containing protein [Chitinophaga polysaccharea]|uniref:macro domain-containing protein n=1 Tax=Chitinophaga TaxID=79328 RepID=UPI00145526E1|nr:MULTISPECIES: macro domain-containing protein [Chitinophaga]NLR58227.1 macro domain-containing protein [Chitinophaga polysaccharea]NLU90753.1 macro domain-containing protein [Chitinophaga sp. Ak27]
MITYINEGDIFLIPGVNNYAHGCNCAGAMGKGIAVTFKEKFPKMYQEYKQLCRNKQFTPGDVFMHNYGGGMVFNLGTQQSWTTKATIEAVATSLGKMLWLAKENHVDKIALPKIGAGLGKLDWDDVKQVIDKQAAAYPDIALFVVENFKG